MSGSNVFNFFCPYQLAWINEAAPVAGAEKSRRIGWTYVDAFARTLERGGASPVGYDHWHSSADLTAAEEYIGYCAEFVKLIGAVARVLDTAEEEFTDEETGDVAKIITKKIVFDNGRKITAGSSNPKFFRSKGGSVGLDEFAFHPQGRELYKAAHATARFWGYPLRFWSTHNGPGSYFNALINQARNGKLRAKIHRVTVLDAVEQGIVERIRMRRDRLSDVPAADARARQEWLDGLRSECPDEDVWNEEYLCIPASDASALLSYELIAGCERTPDELRVVEDPREIKFNGPLYAGWDIARKQDMSVIWVLGKVGDVWETRLVKRFQNTPYSTQEEYFHLLMSCGIKRACLDSTGLGGMLAERAIQRFGGYRVEAVNFTPQVKSDLAMPLQRLFQDKLIRVPADAQTREGLHKVRKIVTSAGNVRFDAKHDEDGHADEFWSVGLAYHAADELTGPRKKALAEMPDGF